MTIQKKDILLTAASVAAAISGAASASASDLPSKTSHPAAPTADDWTGLYAGVSIGAGSGQAGYWNGDYNIDTGFVAGGHVGYNAELASHLILGAEVAYSMGPRKLNSHGTEGDFGAGDEYGISPVIDLKGRVGYDLGSAMIYAFGGVSSMPLHSDYSVNTYENYGYNIGAGFDYKVTKNVSIGAEYIYRKTTSAYKFDPGSYDHDTATHLSEAVLRASYHF